MNAASGRKRTDAASRTIRAAVGTIFDAFIDPKALGPYGFRRAAWHAASMSLSRVKAAGTDWRCVLQYAGSFDGRKILRTY